MSPKNDDEIANELENLKSEIEEMTKVLEQKQTDW